MMTPKPFRERPRTTSIEADDVFPLSRMLPGGTATTYSIAWGDMSAQIVQEVAEARQEMVDGFTATINWTTAELAAKAPIVHTHAINDVTGLSAALSGLSGREPVIAAGTTAQYWRGDKSWQPVLGLPISTLTQTALNAKLNNPGTPASRAIALGTSYQATDPAKPAYISASVETSYSITVAGTQQDTVELRIGPDATTVASGAGGYVITTFRSSLTGIALAIGMAQVQRSQLATVLPAGWYFALRRTVGTNAAIQGVMEHPFG